MYLTLVSSTCLLLPRIDSHFVIKIADFGLSEDIFQRNREGVNGEVAKLPVKWMAPESLSDGHFSEKSDVVSLLSCLNILQMSSLNIQWSFGVTMWEIFSGGKSYPGVNPLSPLQMLAEGERMPKPYNEACTDEV